MPGTLYITGDKAADGLLNEDGTALLIGMLLDQQVPMEWAFTGPATLRERLGHLDARKIAAMDVDEFVAVCSEKPAIHRFPGAMGKRIHQVCTVLADEYDGAASNIWKDVDSGAELYRRLHALPGYGEEKAKIFLAILGKRLNAAPRGWEEGASPFGDPTPRSIADVDSAESLARVREWKRAQKAKGKGKAE